MINRTMNGKEYALDFTFNSTLYLEDFDIQAISELDRKPFKVVRLTSELLYGALNHNEDKVITASETKACLESVTKEGKIAELFQELLELLKDSEFFKSLQEIAQEEE